MDIKCKVSGSPHVVENLRSGYALSDSQLPLFLLFVEHFALIIIYEGLGDAINAVFPKTKQQLCNVHQIRNTTRFVQWKDRKAICADLKKIYGALNLDNAEYAKEEFRKKGDKKYPSIMRTWGANWVEHTTFFNYPFSIILMKSGV